MPSESKPHMDQVFEAFDSWERTQVCIRGHVRVVREEVERLVEQVEALQREVKVGEYAYTGLRERMEAENTRLQEQLGSARLTIETLEDEQALLDIIDGLKEQLEALERAYRQACMNLATIRPDLTREGDWTLGEFADLYYDALLDGWGGILGYDRGRKPGVSSPASEPKP